MAANPQSPLRSFLAVFVGFGLDRIVLLLLTVLFASTFGLKNGQPTPGYLFTNALFTLLPALFGGAVTAFMSAFKPVRHGAALASVLFILGVLQYLHYAGHQPFWYQLLMQVLPAAAAFNGAVLFTRATT